MTVFTGTDGNDTLNLSVLAALDPSLGHQLQGLEGNDRLFGASGNDTLIGAGGNDQLDGGSGADSMNGGAGNDSYVVDNVGDTIDDSDGNGGINAYVSYTIPIMGLGLSLRTAGITGTGTGGNELIISYVSNTTLNGLGGHDVLKGGTSSIVNGGDGNDILEITNGNTGTLNGGAGNDTYNVYATGGNLIINEYSSLGGSALGIDTIFTLVDFSLNGTSGVSFSGGINFIENLTLAVLDVTPGDKLGGPTNGTGNGLNNVIIGNRKDNTLSGVVGDDSIYGSYGNDLIDGGNGNDSLEGNEGNDTLIAGSGSDTLVGGNGDDSYTIDSSDTITEIAGGGTADTVTVSGSWSSSAEVETINVTGTNAVSITLINTVGTVINWSSSSSANDTLTGGTGNDTLGGGAGIDRLTGGPGADTFVFGRSGLSATGSTGTSIRQDTITDFNPSQSDKIRLDSATFSALLSFQGNNLSATGGFATKSGSSGIDTVNAYIVYDTVNGTLYYNPNLTAFGDGGGGYFATLTGFPSLAATDFSIV